MTYDSQIAALSPWGYWKTNETSGNLADSSGNSRTMVVTGSPTYAQTGPDGSANAISWTNVASQHAETTATTNAGVFTYVVWVYLTGAPSSNLALMSRATSYNTAGAADGRLFVDTAGKVNFSVFSGSTFTLTAPSALPTNQWVMVTASVGAAGMRLRQNKVSQATNGVTSAYTGASQVILLRGGDTGYTGTAPVVESRPSYFTSQLSNADTDSLYDAGVPSPITISGETFTVSLAAVDGSPLLPVTVSGETFSSVVTARDGSALVAIAVAGDAFGSVVTMLDGGPAGSTVSGESFSAVVWMLDGGVLVPAGTDTSNFMRGRRRVGVATVELEVPVAVPPSAITTTRVDKAIALPEPELVNGRPT